MLALNISREAGSDDSYFGHVRAASTELPRPNANLNRTPTAPRGTECALRVPRGSLRKRAQELARAPGEGRRRGPTGARPRATTPLSHAVDLIVASLFGAGVIAAMLSTVDTFIYSFAAVYAV